MPPFGRGGAGNINAVTAETAKLTSDLEANRVPSTSSSSSSSDTAAVNAHLASESDHLHHQITPQQYANIGRGGAGNLVEAKDLEQPDDVTTARRVASVSEGSAGYGRGGAGNQAFWVGVGEEVRREREREERLGRERLREEVERGVEERLAVPEKARTVEGKTR